MSTVLSADLVTQVVQERQTEAAAHALAVRLVAARRWQRRAEVAARRARLARTAVR